MIIVVDLDKQVHKPILQMNEARNIFNGQLIRLKAPFIFGCYNN